MNRHSLSESGPGGRLALNAEKTRLLLQTILPLAVVVIGIKLGKLMFAFMHMDELETPLRAIYSSWLVRVTVSVFAVFWIGKIVSPRRRWEIAAFPFIGLVLAKLARAWWLGSTKVAYSWFLDGARELRLVCSAVFGAVRMDLVFLASFTIAVYVVVRFTPVRYGRVLRVMLIGCTASLLALSGLELAQYCKLGTTGTGSLLAFFVTNAVALWPMLRAQIDVASMASLVLPLVIGWAVALVVRSRCAKTEADSERRLRGAVPVVLAISLATAFVHPTLVDHRFDRFAENTYMGLSDLIPWRSAGQLEAVKRANRLPVVFDTSGAVLRPRGGATTNPRNVIIIMLESARADSTSIYNAKVSATPFLADFAKRGSMVPDMYAVIPRTSAAWVAVLDGVWPSTDEEMMTWAKRPQPGLRSLPQLLAARGYTSAFFTTTHLSFSYDAALIKGMQFESVYDGDSLPKQGFEEPSFWGFEDRMMLAPSLNWVRAQRDNRHPFLLVMMTNVGHYTYEYPSKWPARSFGNIDPSYNSYLNCLSYVDSVIKDFVAGLDELGVLSSSIVIVLGDHGESFGEHGPRTHALELYEETVKIPAILYADGVIPRGASISGLRQEVDIVPTVVDALGLTAEHAVFPGTSLLKPVPMDRPVYFSGALYSQATALRKGGLKFIYNFGRTPTEAYAVDQDPRERHDIAPTFSRSAIEDAEMDMLVWRERVSRFYTSARGAGSAVH